MNVSRRRFVWGALGVAVIALAFVLYWFQPQKLVLDEGIDEAAPTAGARESSARDTENPAGTEPPSQPDELAAAPFVSLDHETEGVARVLELADGTRVLRLESFRTSNGPDVFVYLSANTPDGEEAAFDDDFVNLGRMKGNVGDQNYDIPVGEDLTRFGSVVIWCDRFDSAFGAAPLAVA